MLQHATPYQRVSIASFAVSMLFFPLLAWAQWVPAQGEGTFAIGYQFTRITDHFFSVNLDGYVDPATGYVGGPGKRFYLGDVYGQAVNGSVSYGVWRGLGVSASATYLTSKYDGRFVEGPRDDGQYHGSLQDGLVTAQYMFQWNEFAITPSVGRRFPITGYPTLGHVSVGKDLRETPVGISIGRSLGPFLPRAFLTGSFTYSFVENHHEHSLDQRHFGASGGYILSNTLSLGSFTEYVNTIDGFDWANDDLSGEEEWHDHDAAAKAKYLRVGGYAGFTLSRRFGFRISYLATPSGENSHAGRSITFEPSWNFTAPLVH
jgi:hypothetical protein